MRKLLSFIERIDKPYNYRRKFLHTLSSTVQLEMILKTKSQAVSSVQIHRQEEVNIKP